MSNSSNNNRMQHEHGGAEEENAGTRTTTTVVTLHVTGMMCQRNCAATVQRALLALEDCVDAEVSFAEQRAVATFAVGTQRRQQLLPTAGGGRRGGRGL